MAQEKMVSPIEPRAQASAQLKKIRLIMMPLCRVLSTSRNIALSSSCLSTWHYLLYKLGDLISHLSILEAAFVPVLKIIFSIGLDNANKPLWSFCINLFHDFISVKFRHMASPGEYLCVPLNQNLLSQSCMHLKALLDVQHIKWLPWDVTSFDFQLEILGSIVNPELLQNTTLEMTVTVMDSATQIFQLLLQGVRVDCKAKFTYNNVQICITKACQFVKKVFLDLVGKQKGDSCAVLVQFGLQFMKVTVEELDRSLLASGKYEICLDIKHIKEMQYAECSPKVSYPEIRPLSYMEMVSPGVYMIAVSMSMVAQFTGELSHGHADQLALVFCSSDFPENLHAAVAFLYMQILRPVDNRLRMKWLMVWNKIAKCLNEQIIPYLKHSCGASGHDVLYQFFCYPFFAFLSSGRISTLWNAQNSSESYLPVTQDLEVGLAIEVYRSLCANSNCGSEAAYKVFLERFYEYLVSIIDENMSSFQANLEYCSEKKFKSIAILSAVGEVVIGLLENAQILNHANYELKETNEESAGRGQPNLFLSCLKLVNRFMRLSRFGFKANPAEQHQVTSRFFSSLSTFVGHLILKKDILLLFEIIGDQLTEWFSLSGTLYFEMKQGETIDQLEKLWLKTVGCLKMSQLISDGFFLQKQRLLFQAAVDHPHNLISVATTSIWRASRSGNTSLQHSGCSVSKLDELLMDRRKGIDGSSDADRAIAIEELDISRKFALPTSEKRIITSNSTEHTDRNGESLKISAGLGRKRLKIMKYSTEPKLGKNTVHRGGSSSKTDTGAFSPHHVESKVGRKPELILEMLKRKR